MSSNRIKLYVFFLISCIGGYIWIFFNFTVFSDNEVGVCIFKHITTIPCPSCGSTRSVMSLFKGNITEALYWNPIGLILTVILIVSPFWVIYDLIARKDSLFRFYKKMELLLKKKKIAIPILLFVLINWIWNIYKNL